ncbi:hypothetical protein Deipe_1540 [Deinococcus peraridilitoris DSM 19664]|uniref:Uncharacterized protein n=1 Tax=Deinococcus peraridilitoris (strain DSM 19664 / LMG 22246 / CIP 109416 / KR-200) TaxID=937777 RepID=K9ZZQ1_DEIPD|nr:hypothetical protein Deipe_1540 [Deinococcus peraridilitoris DSM 19664]
MNRPRPFPLREPVSDTTIRCYAYAVHPRQENGESCQCHECRAKREQATGGKQVLRERAGTKLWR